MGPVAPQTTGGSYGDLINGGNGDGQTEDYSSRLVSWNNHKYATATFYWKKGAAQYIKMRVLDGIADDSFTVEALHCNGEWRFIGEYTDEEPILDTETWYIREFSLTDEDGNSIVCKGRGKKGLTIRITSTGPIWLGYYTFGQVAVDWIELYGSGSGK